MLVCVYSVGLFCFNHKLKVAIICFIILLILGLGYFSSPNLSFYFNYSICVGFVHMSICFCLFFLLIFWYVQVKHSRTSSPKSYVQDFRELIDIYTRKKMPDKKEHNVMFQEMEHDSDSSTDTLNASVFEANIMSQNELDKVEDQSFSENDDDVHSAKECRFPASDEEKMSVEYLEDECDLVQGVDDMDGNSLFF